MVEDNDFVAANDFVDDKDTVIIVESYRKGCQYPLLFLKFENEFIFMCT